MAARCFRFLLERFLPYTAPLVLWSVAIDLLTQRQAGVEHPGLSLATAVAALSSIILGAIVRFTDEIKDAEVDRQYYPDRPLPSGRITERDLWLMSALASAIAVAANMVWRWALPEYLVVLGFTWLMAKWFFLPKLISKNRMLALATHSPMYLLMNLYQIAVFARSRGLESPTWAQVALAAWLMLPFYSYEFARKTYLPKEEQAGYQSYSAILGHRAAAAAGFAFVALHVALLFPLAGSLRTSNLVLALLAALALPYAAVTAAYVAGKAGSSVPLEKTSGGFWMGSLALFAAGAWWRF